MQLHSCSEAELRKGDVIAAPGDAAEEGYTRYIGYSGDGSAARYAMECGRFQALQTSVNIADQEAIDLTLPLAPSMASASSPSGRSPIRPGSGPRSRATIITVAYWERLQKLQYDFQRATLAPPSPTALRFTLSVPGVDTAIVGTKKPGRWHENADQVRAGACRRQSSRRPPALAGGRRRGLGRADVSETIGRAGRASDRGKHNTGRPHSRLASIASLRLYPIKVLLRANEQCTIDGGVGCQRFLFQVVFGDQIEFLGGREHDADALFALDVDLAVGTDRRRGKVAAKPLVPVDLACLGIEATCHAVVGNEVQFLADNKRRGGCGTFLFSVQATCVFVTSPWPSGRIASSFGVS